MAKGKNETVETPERQETNEAAPAKIKRKRRKFERVIESNYSPERAALSISPFDRPLQVVRGNISIPGVRLVSSVFGCAVCIDSKSTVLKNPTLGQLFSELQALYAEQTK